MGQPSAADAVGLYVEELAVGVYVDDGCLEEKVQMWCWWRCKLLIINIPGSNPSKII